MARFTTIFVTYILLIFHFYTIMVYTYHVDTLYDLSPFIRVYKNGTVERLVGTETVPASINCSIGVQSKDVQISLASGIRARLYLPIHLNPTQKLPLLVYFHGGAFFTGSAANPSFHTHLNLLVAKANIVAVSVNYRLAPENPLPIGYHDSWIALKWVFSHYRGRGTEPWLKNHAHFRQVYLGGDSAGANIAHNMAIRAGLDRDYGISFEGLFLDCPHFWGRKPVGKEMDPANRQLVRLAISIWIHAYPNSTYLDNPLLNPSVDPNLYRLGCKKILIVVAQPDILRDRGLYYYHALIRSGWRGDVKALDFKGEEHVFSLRFPDRPNSIALRNELAYFLNHGKKR